jgi:hypothetical protein
MKRKPSKGHGTRGQYNGNAKLSQADRNAIIRKLRNGTSGADLARQYHLTPAEISQIKHGKRFNKRK